MWPALHPIIISGYYLTTPMTSPWGDNSHDSSASCWSGWWVHLDWLLLTSYLELNSKPLLAWHHTTAPPSMSLYKVLENYKKYVCVEGINFSYSVLKITGYKGGHRKFWETWKWKRNEGMNFFNIESPMIESSEWFNQTNLHIWVKKNKKAKCGFLTCDVNAFNTMSYVNGWISICTCIS